MATPQESTTTVSGRRCTRSRARTAATSTLTSSAPAATSTELTSTTSQAAQQIQSSAAPPSSSTQDAQLESSTQAASSATGTSSAVFSSVAKSSVLANLAPTGGAAVAPLPTPDVTGTQAIVSAAAEPTTAPSTTPAPTSSDSILAAVTSTSALSSAAPSQSSVAALPEQPGSSSLSSSPSDSPAAQPQTTETGIPTGGSAGVISPDQGVPEGNGLTLPADGQTNVAGIAGGVVGGFVGIALISALFFICLRRRKTGTFEKWQQRISEKSQGNDGLLAKLRAIPEKVKGIPAAAGMLFAKLKGKKAGPASNPYRRHSMRSSISSVYSVRSNRRSVSISEPPSKFRQQLRGFSDRMPSLKRSKTLLQKKQDSLVVGNKSPFPGIVEDPVLRNSKGVDNPFKDPEGPPKNLLLLNPDEEASAQKNHVDGLQDQQRGPIAPQPTAMSERGSRDPFASILDELEERNGSGTPEWLRDNVQKHKRTTSAQTALRSHPPSTYTASVYTTAENPFFDPSDAPPVPNQPLPPNPPSRPANAYAPLPSFNATSSTISRDSNMSFFFGEPGPSRPTTNMFSSKVRQSDPFDLDRPEVLGFGNVGGRTVRGSVTRQNSRSRRSSVPNWVNVDDGPYERASAVPGPLRNPSVKR